MTGEKWIGEGYTKRELALKCYDYLHKDELQINHSSSESMRQIGAASAEGLCKMGAAALSEGAEGSVDFSGLSLDCELSGEFLRFGPLAKASEMTSLC